MVTTTFLRRELILSIAKKKELRESFQNFNMAGYSEAVSGIGHVLGDGFYFHTDVQRGMQSHSSERGLFKENKDIYFWWFSPDGTILHENRTHLNNIGLISNTDSVEGEKRSGEFRIAVLGDEMTGATTSNISWPDVLENHLNKGDENARVFRVYNFGHLDSGIHEWREIWEKRVEKFDIDLLLVNLTDHAVGRVGDVYADVSHWDGVPGFRYVSYVLPDGQEAVTWIRGLPGVSSLRSPDCYTSKLLTFWLPTGVARDKSAMAWLREKVIDDYVEGADFERCIDPMNPRDHAYPDIPVYSDEECKIQAGKHLKWFKENVPDVLFLMNPWYPHFTDYHDFKSLEIFSDIDQSIEVIDMRSRYQLWGIHDDISIVYSKFAREKWSDEGHKLYGAAVGDVVLNHLNGVSRFLPGT